MHRNGKMEWGFVAWLLLCGMLFTALSPVRAAHISTADGSFALATPAKTMCRMAAAPKPCCPIGQGAQTNPSAPSVKPGACSCHVRPAPVTPNSTPEPAALFNTTTPLLGIVPATLPIVNVLPRFAPIAALRPAFSISPPLRSPPRFADNGRAPPVSLS